MKISKWSHNIKFFDKCILSPLLIPLLFFFPHLFYFINLLSCSYVDDRVNVQFIDSQHQVMVILMIYWRSLSCPQSKSMPGQCQYTAGVDVVGSRCNHSLNSHNLFYFLSRVMGCYIDKSGRMEQYFRTGRGPHMWKGLDCLRTRLGHQSRNLNFGWRSERLDIRSWV